MADPAPLDDNAQKRRRTRQPRSPSRGRGLLRYAALLDATAALLQTENPDTIGLYQIAERAGVPPASVYHFFPTKEAAYVALAERYLHGLMAVHREPVDARIALTWQGLVRNDMQRAMEFYNAHVPMNKILYGGYGGVEARNIDEIFTKKITASHYARLDRIYYMPMIKNPEAKFGIRLSILDAIWALSVRQHGKITEAYFEESYKACIAYSRLYLPEYIEPREWLLEAAGRGENVQLGFDVDPDAPAAGQGGGEDEPRLG